MLHASRRNGPPSLSITIPSPDKEKHKENAMAATKRKDASQPRPPPPQEHDDDDDDGDITPREKTVTFSPPATGEDEEGDDSDDDRRSEHSSICQSPSWEGYGQKKKKKKLAAEQKKREKELAEQELKLAKKRLAGKLQKAHPLPDSPGLMASGASSVHRFESQKSSSNQSTRSSKSGRSSKSTSSQQPPPSQQQQQQQQSFVPAWGIAVGAGGYIGGLTIHQAYPPGVVKALMATPPATADSGTSGAAVKKAADAAHNPGSTEKRKPNSGEPQKHAATAEKSPRSMTMPGRSYPPPASRTHALRHTSNTSHGRSNSASATTSATMEAASKFFKAQNMKSTKGSKLYATANVSDDSLHTSSANERGRQKDGGSYVRQARAQSAERSLAGYLDEVAVSTRPQSPKLEQQRPGSSQARVFRLSTQLDGAGAATAASKLEAQEAKSNAHQRTSPTSPTKPVAEHVDYFNFVTKPYAPPSLDLTPPTSSGLLSSIKSRISRRTSSSSSGAQGSRTFKDRAIGAMHITSHPGARSYTESIAPRSVPSSGPPTLYSPTHAPEDFARLPKAARVLGEINAETMQSASHHHPGSRPSEGSSTSSYHDDSSAPPSPASTPDTSRPQSARGLSAAIEEIQKSVFDPSDERLPISEPRTVEVSPERDSDSGQSSSTTPHATSDAQSDGRRTSGGDRLPPPTSDRPTSKGRPLEDLVRPASRGRLLDDIERPASRGRLLDVDEQRPKSRGRRLETSGASGAAAADAPGMTAVDEFSRTALPIDIDAQSFVTSLTSFDAIGSSASLAPLGLGLDKQDGGDAASDHSRPGSRHSHKGDDGKDRPRSRNSRNKDKKSNSHSKQMSIVNEEPRSAVEESAAPALPTEAADQPTGKQGSERPSVSFLPPLKHESLPPPKSKARSSTQTSAPAVLEPHRTYSKTPFVPSEPSSGRSSPSAAYLQEARRSAPLVPSPLSSGGSSAATTPGGRPKAAAGVTASRPGVKSVSSTPAVVSASRQPPAAASSISTSKALSPTTGAGVPQFRIPAQEPEQVNRPVAKMLVECCSCKFFHDMPSRVYECMASPDAVVTDRSLGVSGAITTMVKCPWCSHNMSTQCCAGYAALVYLKERMH